jgi:hypothetical protein
LEALAVTEAAVAAEVHQALDVHLHFAAQIAFDLVFRLEELADLLDVAFRQLFGLLRRIDACLLADIERGLLADAVQVRKRVRDVLVVGEVDACNTSHDLSLTLLVTGILTNDADHTLAADHLALVANLFD